MSDDELLHNMSRAFWASNGGSDNSMRAVLDVLHAHGYRRCAEGQKVTQYCSAWEQADKACRDLTEKVIPNIRKRAEKAEAEVERLEKDNAGWQDGYSALSAEVERLRGALKSTAAFLHHCWCDVQMSDYSFQRLSEQMEIIDAAIDAARGES